MITGMRTGHVKQAAQGFLLGVVCMLSSLFACAKPADEGLWIASMRGDKEAMHRFMDGGGDPNYVRGGWSILMRVAGEGRGDIAELLIDHGARVNFKGKDGASALTIAAEQGNAPVARTLLAHGADVNIHNNHGNTALMYAAEYGHPEMIRLLLDAGADMTTKDQDGETALMTAMRRNRADIVKMLKDAGATSKKK
jgi:ankyrin repeat protein